MPALFMLVGVPGSGKSTWLKNRRSVDGYVIVSTDNYIEARAQEEGKTYSEVFDKYIKTATAQLRRDLEMARREGKHILWDQTNIGAAKRTKALKAFPEYHKVAIVFATPDLRTLKKRLANRPGKVIPDTVMQRMIANFQEPTEAEGFDDIWHIN